MLQVLGDEGISILLCQELGRCEVIANSLEEFSHSNVIFGKVLRDSDIVLSLGEEFRHRNIILREELGHTDVILDLIEELSDCTVEKLGQIGIVCRSQILQSVLHVAFVIESV